MRECLAHAAAELFSTAGFDGASIRDVERHAGVSRGIAPYHFPTKDALWRAGVCWLMDRFHEEMRRYEDVLRVVSAQERARVLLRLYVQFAAEFPQYFRLVVLEGSADTDRAEWLAREHVRRHIDFFHRMAGRGSVQASEAEAISYFTLLGAASTVFAARAQCRQLFGIDPAADDFVDRMADRVAEIYLFEGAP